jgi:hypothetical protein
VVEQRAACSLPSADIHTTVTRCNSLVQYNFAMAIYAEMRWLRYTSRIIGVMVLWLLNFY